MNEYGQPVLYTIVTGSPRRPTYQQAGGFRPSRRVDVCVIASPNGYRFIDAGVLTAKTGHTVRHQYKEPDAPDVLPPADAMVVAPITCNSLAKWAVGISDTLPLGLLVEAVGKRQPVVAIPFSNRDQISFPAIQQAMSALTAWGVTILVGDDIYKQHEPGTGDNYVHLFPWHLAWQALLHHPRLDFGR